MEICSSEMGWPKREEMSDMENMAGGGGKRFPGLVTKRVTKSQYYQS